MLTLFLHIKAELLRLSHSVHRILLVTKFFTFLSDKQIVLRTIWISHSENGDLTGIVKELYIYTVLSMIEKATNDYIEYKSVFRPVIHETSL